MPARLACGFTPRRLDRRIHSLGFWEALQDLQIDRVCVIAPVMRRYPLAEAVGVAPLTEIRALLED